MATEQFPGNFRDKRLDSMDDVIDFSKWPKPVLNELKLEQRPGYLNAVRAVKMWVARDSCEVIKKSTGLNNGQVRRLVDRCKELNPRTGTIVGFWVCVPGYTATRKSRQFCKPAEDGDSNGALTRLFVDHEDLHKKLVQYIERRCESGAAPVAALTPANVHDRFIALCKDKGLHNAKLWPFTKKRRGYEAVRRWYRAEQYHNPRRGISNEFGAEKGKLARLDFQTSNNPKPRDAHLAYERVELDEHKKDALYSVVTPIEADRFVAVATTRMWALAMLDVGSTVCLSSGMSYRRRYSRADVLRLVYGALQPSERKTLMIQNEHFKYAEGACYPGEHDDYALNAWQLLALDRDAAHFSLDVLSVVDEIIGSHVLGERLGQPTARPNIESFFKLLKFIAENMPSATGNRPDSPARRNPESAAVKWVVVAPLAEHILDVVCRNYNVTPSAQCGGISPLQRLQEMTATGRIFRCPVGELRAKTLYRFLPRYEVTLSRKRGPYSRGPLGVNLFGGRYVGPELTQDDELAASTDLGASLYVQNDARFAVVVPDAFPDRSYRVMLRGKYSDEPHTLEWRRLASAYAKNGHVSGHADAPNLSTGLARGLGQAARSNKGAAVLLSGVVAFQERFGRGDNVYIDLPPSEVQRITEYAQDIYKADDGDEGDDDEATSFVSGGPPAPRPPRPGAIANDPSAEPKGQRAGGSGADPFGLLGGA
jgi:hypothetical protein